MKHVQRWKVLALLCASMSTSLIACDPPRRFEASSTEAPAVREGGAPEGFEAGLGSGPLTSLDGTTPAGSLGSTSGSDVNSASSSLAPHSSDKPVSGNSAEPTGGTEGSSDSNVSIVVPNTSDGDDGTLTSSGHPTEPAPGSDQHGSSADTSEPIDECPNHEQQERGSCGCGHDPHPLCESLIDALVHRYPFVFPSNQQPPHLVDDLVGSADAVAFESRLKDDGALLLEGDQAYIELPPRIVSPLTEATFELWLRWWGGDTNQRILNFGRAPDGDDAPENFLSISPKGSNGVLSVQFRTDPDDRGDRLETDAPLSTDNLEHITLVVRPNEILLYLNGEVAQTATTPHRLDQLDDTENWLGRALYEEYPRYNGALYEFRIFGRALTVEEIRKTHEIGLAMP